MTDHTINITIGTSESALRRRAAKEGYILRKGRGADYDGYALVNCQTGGIDFGFQYDATLEEIAEFLKPDSSDGTKTRYTQPEKGTDR